MLIDTLSSVLLNGTKTVLDVWLAGARMNKACEADLLLQRITNYGQAMVSY